MKKTLIITAALLSVIFISSNAFSWGGGGYGRGCGGGYGNNNGSSVLPSLTEEQKGALADLRQKFIDETYEVRSAMMGKKQNIRMLLETSSPDKTKLTALSDDILELKGQMQAKRIDFILKAKEIAPGLNASDLRMFGRGFGKGRHFAGNRPCRDAGKAMGQGAGMGYGNGPCTQ